MYIIICCVLHRKKSTIGLTVSHPNTVVLKNGKCDPKPHLARYEGTNREEQDRQGREGNIHAILDSPIISPGFYLKLWVQF